MGGTGPGYSSCLDHLCGWPVCGWLYGHTHVADVKNVLGTCIATNPLGYLNLEPQNVGRFRSLCVLKVGRGKKGEKAEDGSFWLGRVEGGRTEEEKKKERDKEETERLLKGAGPAKPIPTPPPL
eukprot:CAMPEP_0201538850 /NCGR_PEP_ID=MMETSP0161_2-20130828/68739_1 /ASSEMBLY_ACC=CAM_ASM_000251 /TAXON_ID=180227 /ORGANISM="Neoparamoeba aestuarina, Strain SoJaBio B1-5/56/2" /LENGTH=123 /DNA_ID=CAMNT_0047945917 /DNA_START=88 /DNA_END=455 /DNA_ORIENTATION=-